MALNTQLANATVNGQGDNLAARLNNGYLRIYDGSRPSTGGTATTLLAELTCGTPFAAGAASGVLTLGAITQDASANATGTGTERVTRGAPAAYVLIRNGSRSTG